MRTKLIILLIVLSSTEIFSQGPPIITDTPILLGLSGGGVRTFGKVVQSDAGSTFIQMLIIPYNFTSKFQVGLVQNYTFRSLNIGEHNSGLGNTAVFAKLQLFKVDGKAKTFRSIVKLVQRFPTGKMSIGDNSYGTTLQWNIGYITTEYGLYGTLGYTLNSSNVPDNLNYDLAFGYPLLPQKYPVMQLNVFIEANAKVNFDSNQHILFISPGIQLIPLNTFLIETSLQIPVVQNNFSTKANYNYLLGIRYLFF
ncbi:hypothetical protein MNBD_IGNAVI01-919 [hydrothermal vent metagenome]|uniref:Uncharacterized protein n=1 Tax=hydrothermal vent metagenome TaxID=652676 RepID=A0A3B1C6W8_9ZZZZ